MLDFLIIGTIFGLTAGISPGPLLTLVITQTLKHNKFEGIKVALVPLIADVPVIAIALYVYSQLTDFHTILGIISFLGAIFLAYLGYESLNTQGLQIDLQKTPPQSIKKGIIVNMLNPHPYIFWITVGAPMVLKGYKIHPGAALIFMGTFYGFLIGSKIAVALFVDRSRSFLNNTGYIWVMRILGVALFVFSLLFIRDGLRLMDFGIL